MFSFFKKIANNEWFQTLVLLVIILNAVFIWLETYPKIMEHYSMVIVPVLVWSQLLFVIEIALRILAHWPAHYKNFFKDFWNKFDFTIVALSFLPDIGWFITVTRVIRVLRILRVFSISDTLRNYLENLKTTFAAVCAGGCLYLILAYTLSIVWFYMFWDIDAVHWWTLHDAFVSIVFMSLLQDLRGIFGTILGTYPSAIIFIIFFYLLESSILIKLLKVTHQTHASNKR